ncbi:mycofactocin biosynthesis glycosyltransferase MftF [Microbacterium kribbense]|uniref:Mycofactocin biosynthesis glycosyltransferase MftF n=1 Tax=Microbacterium kribbense TaxID=433645 RepID=A0ABP7GAR4_9MICO
MSVRVSRAGTQKARDKRSPQLFDGDPQRRRLPDGFVVELAPNVTVGDDGGTLVCSFPEIIGLLADRGRALLHGRRMTVDGPETAQLVRDLMDAGLAHPVVAELPLADSDDITVVIPVKDRPRELTRLLDSLGGRLHTIVVDDGSDDPAATKDITQAHGCRVVLLPENIGPGGARNAGLREVTTGLVAFVDSDVVAEPDALLMLARHFADPAVGVALPRVIGLFEGDRTTWLGRYENSRSSLDLGELPSFVHAGSAAPWAPGTVTINRTAVIRDGFDESMQVGEDVDIVFRLGLDGWRTRFDPTVTVRHDHRATLGKWFRRKVFYASSAEPLNARFPYYVVPSLLTATDLGLIAAALAQRRWSVPVIGGLAALSAVRTVRRLRHAGAVRGAPVPEATAVAARSAWGHLQLLGLHVCSLLVRQWWPAAAVAAVFSRRVRRAVAVAAVVDAVVFRRRNRADLDLPRYFVGRRLDDVAFGFGWWLGAWRARSPASVLPDLRGVELPRSRTDLITFTRPAR